MNCPTCASSIIGSPQLSKKRFGSPERTSYILSSQHKRRCSELHFLFPLVVLVLISLPSNMALDEEATLSEQNEEHLVVRSLNEVEDRIDPRIRPSDRPGSQELDEGYAQQLTDYLHHKDPHHPLEKEEEPLYVSKLHISSKSLLLYTTYLI